MNTRFSLFLVCLPVLGLPAVACSSSTVSGTPVAADGGDPDAGMTDAPAGGTMCTMARDQTLVPINKVWTGKVTVISDTGGVKTLYVDATGGSSADAIKNARTYVDLGAGSKVEITDVAATWD